MVFIITIGYNHEKNLIIINRVDTKIPKSYSPAL